MYDIFERKYTAQKKLGWLMGGMYVFFDLGWYIIKI